MAMVIERASYQLLLMILRMLDIKRDCWRFDRILSELGQCQVKSIIALIGVIVVMYWPRG
jgi:hypothetical protein